MSLAEAVVATVLVLAERAGVDMPQPTPERDLGTARELSRMMTR